MKYLMSLVNIVIEEDIITQFKILVLVGGIQISIYIWKICFAIIDPKSYPRMFWYWLRTVCVTHIPQLASYQIREIAGCACAGNAGNVFPRHWLQRKPLVSDPSMHHGTCVTHVPWCMLGLLTCGGGENVTAIPGACATRNYTYLARGPWQSPGHIHWYVFDSVHVGEHADPPNQCCVTMELLYDLQ